MIVNIISYERKRDLQILIESFLEKDRESFSEQYHTDSDGKADFYAQIYRILSQNAAPMDIPAAGDLTNAELRNAAIEWHVLLRPIWKHFKMAMFDYKENVLPEREALEIPVSGFSDPSSPLYEYKDLPGYDPMSEDKFYPVKIRGTSFKVTLSFDAGLITVFRKDLNPVNSFIDIMKNVPIDLFSKCGYCKKVIIVTRAGKKYCPGCGAKAKQQERWNDDPEAAKAKERRRYKERRKTFKKSLTKLERGIILALRKKQEVNPETASKEKLDIGAPIR